LNSLTVAAYFQAWAERESAKEREQVKRVR